MALVLNDEGSAKDDGQEVVGTSFSRWGTVLAMLLVYIVSYIDRQVLTIVVDPVRTSLDIGDTEIGLLQGIIFGAVLTVAAVPMSYLIDHYNRVRVLICCIIVWSLATLYCAFVTSFVELVIGRIGLAIAEAVVPMAAMSVIGDLFPRHKVGRAAAVFMNGTYFGNGTALMLSGWMIAWMTPMQGQPFPIMGTFEVWRGLFIGMACLSIAVAIILFVFLKEPPRRELTKATVDSDAFWAFFWARRRFILSYCLFAFCIATVGYSLYAWPATLLIRIHGMPASDVGVIIGPMFILTSIPGTVIAAWFGSRCTPERALQHTILTMLCFVAILCPLVLLLTLGSKLVAIVALAGVLLMYAATQAAILTPIQLIAPNRMRGRLAAVSSLIYALPASMGPVAIGFFTDFVFEDAMALGKAMAIILGGMTFVGIFAGLLARREATLLENETEREQVVEPASSPAPA
jgi:MFS family permease